MTKRSLQVLSIIGMSILVAACTPSAIPSGDQAGSSSSATVEQPSRAAGMPVPTEENSVQEKQVFDDTSGAGDNNEAGEYASSSAKPAMQKPTVITVSVENFTFTPNVIAAKKGQKTTIRLTGASGNHGFSIPDLGINTAVSAGKTVEVDLPTDTTGTFNFLCSIPCGPGHRDMNGTITISE